MKTTVTVTNIVPFPLARVPSKVRVGTKPAKIVPFPLTPCTCILCGRPGEIEYRDKYICQNCAAEAFKSFVSIP